MEASNNFSESMSDLSGSPYVVRPARRRDFGLIARAIPSTLESPLEHQCLIAKDRASGEIAAVAALRRAPPGPGGLSARFLAVPVGERPLGPELGRSLVTAICGLAKRNGARTLVCHHPLPEDSPLAVMLRQLGFDQAQTISTYQGDVEANWVKYASLYEGLVDRGKIPEDAQLLRLSEAPRTPVMDLVHRNIGSSPTQIDQLIGSGRVSDELSTVIRVGSSFRGVALLTVSGDTPEAAFAAVDKKARHSWVFVALEYEIHRKLHDAGFTTARYKTNPAIDENVKRMSERLGNELVKQEGIFHLTLRP